MSTLHDQLADYLRIRRALGYELQRAEKLLIQFIDFLDQRDEQLVTVTNTLAWVALPGGSASWRKFRLSAVRGFARYLHALDSAHQVPPADLAPGGPQRATPYLYCDAEIAALMAATTVLRGTLRRATYRTLIGLLAVTGMRVGEAIGLDRHDVNLADGVLIVRGAKHGKSRELALHPSTIDAIGDYTSVRDELCPQPTTPAALISPAGTRLIYCNVHATFRTLRDHAGLQPRSQTCRPRIHDLRHTFAVATVLDWYRAGLDVQPLMPLLSTYLGHVHPKDTYWYLSAAPELLAIAAERLHIANDGGRS
jgi:integrase/recombinase XerD